MKRINTRCGEVKPVTVNCTHTDLRYCEEHDHVWCFTCAKLKALRQVQQ